MKKNNFSEHSLIEYIKSTLNNNNVNTNVSIGIGDDAAALFFKRGSTMYLSTDSCIENTHFTSNDQPSSIAAQLMVANLSDIFAMGVAPSHYLLTINDSKLNRFWYKKFIAELKNIQKQYNLSLVGGNCSRSREKCYQVTIIGFSHRTGKSAYLTRNSCAIGDYIYLTGTLGVSTYCRMKNNRLLKRNERQWIDPCIVLPLLAKAGSAIDISDGLLVDIKKLLGGKGATIRLESIPLAKKLLQDKSMDILEKYNIALNGGEDYVICFTSKRKINHKAAYCIGTVAEKFGIYYQNKIIDSLRTFSPIQKNHFEHFKTV